MTTINKSLFAILLLVFVFVLQLCWLISRAISSLVITTEARMSVWFGQALLLVRSSCLSKSATYRVSPVLFTSRCSSVGRAPAQSQEVGGSSPSTLTIPLWEWSQQNKTRLNILIWWFIGEETPDLIPNSAVKLS